MSSSLAVVGDNAPDLWSDQRIELIRRSVANGAPDLEFILFLEVCKRTGLDPIAKQIYFIKRGDKWQWQTSIDGYRLVADRSGKYAGSDDAVFEERDGKLYSATVTVWKIVATTRCPFTATARWSEYSVSGNMWNKMPHTMLAKCAESLALRKAFPAELSGLYTDTEMEQAGPIQPTRTVDRETGEVIEVDPWEDTKRELALDVAAAPELMKQAERWAQEGKDITKEATHTRGGASIKSRNRALAIWNTQLGGDNDARHALLIDRYRKESLDDLTQQEMSDFNDHLNKLVESNTEDVTDLKDNEGSEEITDYTTAWKLLKGAGITSQNFYERTGMQPGECASPQALYLAGITSVPPEDRP